VGQPLAEKLAEAGHEVFGLSRKPPGFGGRIVPLACDITRRDEVKKIPRAYDAVVNTASSSKGGAEEYHSVYFEGTRNLLAHLQFQKYVWTSSTSVYAQSDGSIVTEESPAEPLVATSRILRETEELLLRDSHGIVLRFAGIYGPDRGHLFQQYLRGEARLHGEGGRWLNMIHREDAVGAIVGRSRNRTRWRNLQCNRQRGCDRARFFHMARKKLKRDLPPAVSEADLAGRKRGVTNKRVSNCKLREQLGYAFLYPTFREGYASEISRLGLA
jgi:nucleoside-diphosphate-sugar epimerase